MPAAVLSFQQLQETITCCNCGIVFSVPQHFRASLRADHRTFWCPSGHTQHYTDASEAEKLRAQLAERDRQLEYERVRAATNHTAREKAERKVRKLEKRAAAGVCSCCNRTFQQLARHMKSKHPGAAVKG